MADDVRILELLDLWHEAVARGETADPAKLCCDCPELLEPLRAKIQYVQKLNRLTDSAGAADTNETTCLAVDVGKIETQSFNLPGQVMNNPNPPAKVGDTFAGFKLIGILGEGSFGTVFRAEDVRLNRKLALKVLHARALVWKGARENFLAEAQAMAAIQHDHVVPIYQVGDLNEQLFIAMPLLGGETLGSRLERDGALSNDEVRRIGREIASGLAAIHAKGLVHRDLKPGNIWLEAGTGRVKILDLGLAHDPRDEVESISGTPKYMSPEQADGKALDARSDLFSLGTYLFSLALGC
jgi:serine/threonine protein kinase